MSEKWQESEKCQEWEDKTMDIQTQCDELEIIIDELKNLL
jgi:L-rhamnose mutarotase